MQARQERMLRAVASAGVSTIATACAHSAGGGHVPEPLMLATVFVLGVLLCFGLAGRRVTLPRLLPGVAATQLLLHAVFTAAEGTGGASVPARHVVHHVESLAATELVVADGHNDGMLWAHVAAGLVTLLTLHAGLGAVRQLLRAVAVRVVAVLALVLGVELGAGRLVRRTGANDAPAALASLISAATRSLRGPPSAHASH